MIGPVPQKHIAPLDARNDPGAPQDGQAPSDLFAQLLGAAAGSPVAADPMLATPDAGAAPEGPALTPELAGQQPPGTDAAAHQPAPLARVFNQDGFFGHAGQAPDQAVMLPGDGAAVEPSEPLAELSSERAEAFLSAGKGFGTKAVATPDNPVMRVLKSGSSPVAATPATVAEGLAFAAAGKAEEAEALTPLQRGALRASPAARSPLHVALRELENGLQVSARVEGLDEAERRQLHDEIAALLSRHGLSAARIQINAVSSRESER